MFRPDFEFVRSLFLSVSATLAVAAHAKPPIPDAVDCANIARADLDHKGQVTLHSTAWSIHVARSENGANGWAAEIREDGPPQSIQDVEVSLIAPAIAGDARRFAAQLWPQLPWPAVRAVRKVRIGAPGVPERWLFELRDETGDVLGTLIQAGWGFGVCN